MTTAPLESLSSKANGIPQITCRSILNPNDPSLRDVYDNILTTLFKDTNDRDEFCDIQYFLASNETNTNKYYVLTFHADKELVGATIFGMIPSDYTFIKSEYTAVLKKTKCNIFNQILDIRRTFIEHETRRLGYAGVDFVVNQIAQTSQMTPEKLAHYVVHPDMVEKIWKIHGFRKIDFPFVMMPISEGKQAVRHLGLYIQPWSAAYKGKKFLEANIVKDIIDASNAFRRIERPLQTYPEYQEMMSYISQHSEVRIL